MDHPIYNIGSVVGNLYYMPRNNTDIVSRDSFTAHFVKTSGSLLCYMYLVVQYLNLVHY